MTAVTIGPVRVTRCVSDSERRTNLAWLAREWHWLGPERSQLLEHWACPALDRGRREVLFAAYRDAQLDADALSQGEMCWQEWDPGLPAAGRDPHDLAVELSAERAAEHLHALTEGEKHGI